MAVNSTEQFVFELCERTLLSSWCYSNPMGKDGDELCDITFRTVGKTRDRFELE